MNWQRRTRPIAWLPPDLALNFSLSPFASPHQNHLTIAEALKSGSARLHAMSESANLDAEVLLAHLLKVERTWLLAHLEEQLNQEQFNQWEGSLSRLERGEALPYVLGEWGFYGLTIHLTTDVLIPRPETELLVETAIDWLAAHPDQRRAVDVGTGSGCIAVAMAVNVPDLEITASDISASALKVAAINVELHGLSKQVSLVHSELLDTIHGPFDLICANLPYIPSERLGSLAVARREPILALDGGEDGLDLIRPFLKKAAPKMDSGGLLLAEIDDSHQEDAIVISSKFFPDAKISLLEDLAGRPRLLHIAT